MGLVLAPRRRCRAAFPMIDEPPQPSCASPPRPTPVEESSDPRVLWDANLLGRLLADVEGLCAEALRVEGEFERQLRDPHDTYQKSARNLVHYLALRRHDIRH